MGEYDSRRVEMQQVQGIMRSVLASYTDEFGLLGIRLFDKNASGNYTPSVRAYFIVKVAQYLKGSSFEDALHDALVRKLAMLGEFCITYMYLENHFFDKKYGIENPQKEAENRLEVARLGKAIDKFINESFSFLHQDKVVAAKSKLFTYYYDGLKLDQNHLKLPFYLSNNADNLHRINGEIDAFVEVEYFLNLFRTYDKKKYRARKLDNENFLRLLLTRSFLINGVFFQIFAELCISCFSRASDAQNLHLIRFARCFGLLQQLVNDNCDFLPISMGFRTACKLPEDTFSDFRRGMVTLPIISYLSNLSQPDLDFLTHFHSRDVSPRYETDFGQREILGKLLHSKAISHSKSLLHMLKAEGEKNMPDPILRNLLNVADSNRYYRAYDMLLSKAKGKDYIVAFC